MFRPIQTGCDDLRQERQEASRRRTTGTGWLTQLTIFVVSAETAGWPTQIHSTVSVCMAVLRHVASCQLPAASPVGFRLCPQLGSDSQQRRFAGRQLIRDTHAFRVCFRTRLASHSPSSQTSTTAAETVTSSTVQPCSSYTRL